MENCILCEKPLPSDVLLKLYNLPSSAQNIPAENELDSDKSIDICLKQCSYCGLVQLDCEPVDYYRDVIRAGGISTTMYNLRCKEYEKLIKKYALDGKRIIEIGCGQGEFLSIWKEFPVIACGIEHNRKLFEIAKSGDLNVYNEFTETEQTVLPGAPFDAFCCFNFLEHQPNPNTMLRCIYNNLTPTGCGMITVPSFEYIIENDSFYELLRDHIGNYTSQTLKHLVESNGFVVDSCELVNRDTWEIMIHKRQKVDVSGLSNNYCSLANELQQFTASRINENKKIAVWGASHQGFTTISSMGIKENISYIIDSAKFKQGKYAPGSHIKIVSPEHFFAEPVDTILIIAPGYTEEIAATIIDKYGNGVEIAVLKSSNIEYYKKD